MYLWALTTGSWRVSFWNAAKRCPAKGRARGGYPRRPSSCWRAELLSGWPRRPTREEKGLLGWRDCISEALGKHISGLPMAFGVYFGRNDLYGPLAVGDESLRGYEVLLILGRRNKVSGNAGFAREWLCPRIVSKWQRRSEIATYTTSGRARAQCSMGRSGSSQRRASSAVPQVT